MTIYRSSHVSKRTRQIKRVQQKKIQVLYQRSATSLLRNSFKYVSGKLGIEEVNDNSNPSHSPINLFR